MTLTKPQTKLKMTDFDIQLAEQLHLGKSPRQNAEIALKQLADIDEAAPAGLGQVAADEIMNVGGVKGKIATTVMGLNLPKYAAAQFGKAKVQQYAQDTYDEYLDSLSEKPVLEQYREPKGFGFEVPLNDALQKQMSRPDNLLRYWQIYHPDGKK